MTRASCSVRATAYLSKSRWRFKKKNVDKSYYTNFTKSSFIYNGRFLSNVIAFSEYLNFTTAVLLRHTALLGTSLEVVFCRSIGALYCLPTLTGGPFSEKIYYYCFGTWLTMTSFEFCFYFSKGLLTQFWNVSKAVQPGFFISMYCIFGMYCP